MPNHYRKNAERRKQLKEAAGRGVLEFSQTGDVGASKGKRSRKGGEASQPDDGEGGSGDEKGDVQKQNVPKDDKTSPSSQPTSKNVEASVAAPEAAPQIRLLRNNRSAASALRPNAPTRAVPPPRHGLFAKYSKNKNKTRTQ